MNFFDCSKRAVLVAMFAISAACGGGGDGGDGGGGNNPPPPPPPSNTGIGSAGGTVTEASGAKVVIPAGALTTNIAIAVAQASAASAPPLPAGVTPFGSMYATTPHGTTFAKPVTITIPFDPSKVPAGTTPVLYKTNPAMSGWLQVAGATVNGSTMSGDVQSFSFEFVGPLPPPPLEKGSPTREWHVLEFTRGNTTVSPIRDEGKQKGGEVNRQYDFGPGTMADPGVPQALPLDTDARGQVFSSPGGGSYAVEAEAPLAREDTDIAGSQISFEQSQSYIKRLPDAKLTLVITQARLEAFDDATSNPGLCAKPGLKCSVQKHAQIYYYVELETKPSASHPARRKLFHHLGYMSLWGWRGHWLLVPSNKTGNLIWNDDDVQVDDDVDAQDGRHARVSLKKRLAVPIDISSVDQNEEFTLKVSVSTDVLDTRPAEFNYLGAHFRDPTAIDGNPQVIIEGLDPTDSPDEPTGDDPNLPAECHALPRGGELRLTSPVYNVPEGAASSGIDLMVTRTDGHAGEVSVKIKTIDGTATAPGDYRSVNTTLTFADGDDAPKFVNVPIVYSTDAEGDKTFTVALSDATGCATIGQATSTVTIIDDTRPVPPPEIFTLGGTVSGLKGSGLVLRTNLFDQVQPTADGTFTFPLPLADGTAYSISVATQPSNPLQTCTLTNGGGTIDGASVTNIEVNCVTQQAVSGLDPTFGSQGKLFSATAAANALALQPDGKLLVLGRLSIARYNTDGSLDTSFGSGGTAPIVTLGNGLDEMKSIALQPDGKIVVAGSTSLPTAFNFDFMVARFNANGTPDTTFGTGGKTLTEFDGLNDQAKAVLIQPDGKIVVAGQAQFGNFVSADQDFAIVRYLADGTLEPTFGGGDGKSTVSVGGKSDFVNAAALQADGSIVVVGRVFTDNGSGNSDMGIVRFLSNGNVDTGFGTERIDFKEGGIVPVGFDGGEWDEALDVLVQSDGQIVIAGYTIHVGVFRGALVRLDSSGAIDTQFGLVNTDAIEKANAIALQADGKVVATGRGNSDFGIVRFTSGGDLDQSFDSDGKLLVDFFGGFDTPNDVLVQPDGKIVAAGVAQNGAGGGLGIVRVIP
jgi:uncharacterized delta-60 repeat protein